MAIGFVMIAYLIILLNIHSTINQKKMIVPFSVSSNAFLYCRGEFEANLLLFAWFCVFSIRPRTRLCLFCYPAHHGSLWDLSLSHLSALFFGISPSPLLYRRIPAHSFFHVASRIGARQARFAFFIRRFPKLLRLNPTSVVSFHSIDPEKSWNEPAISTISNAKSWNWYPKYPRFSRLFSKWSAKHRVLPNPLRWSACFFCLRIFYSASACIHSFR